MQTEEKPAPKAAPKIEEITPSEMDPVKKKKGGIKGQISEKEKSLEEMKALAAEQAKKAKEA